MYLGGFDTEDQAALAYDLAAVKCRGQTAITNFPISEYKGELDNFESVRIAQPTDVGSASVIKDPCTLSVHWLQVTKEELVQQLRRQGKGSNQNSSRYRGVTKHQKGKWEARIGQVVGRKYKYLGLYLTEKEAAIAYDRAAVAARGMSAQTNFEITNYVELLSMALPSFPFLLTHYVSSPVDRPCALVCRCCCCYGLLLFEAFCFPSAARRGRHNTNRQQYPCPNLLSCTLHDNVLIDCLRHHSHCVVQYSLYETGNTGTRECRRRGSEDSERSAGGQARAKW